MRHFLEGRTSEIEVENLRQIRAIFAQFKAVTEAMEDEIAGRLKQKFVLLDKKDSDILLGLQKVENAL